MKKGIHKKRCLKKEAREIFKKNFLKKIEHIFSKREDTFFAHEKSSAQDEGGENISCFFKKKKRLIKRTHFLYGKV